MEQPLALSEEPIVYVYPLSSRLLSGVLAVGGFGFALTALAHRGGATRGWIPELVGVVFGLVFLAEYLETSSQLRLHSDRLVKTWVLGLRSRSASLMGQLDIRERRLARWYWTVKKTTVRSSSGRVSFDSRLRKYQGLKEGLERRARNAGGT